MTHMSDTVGIRALQQHASEVVSRAAAGEELVITDRGRPVARLVPLAADRTAELIESGRARGATISLADLPEPARRRPGAPRPSEVLAEMRSDER